MSNLNGISMENPKPVWPSPVTPIPPEAKKRIQPISNVIDVREHMIRVWKECRRGEMKVEDGSRLIFMLGQIQKCFESSDLEERLRRLEGAA